MAAVVAKLKQRREGGSDGGRDGELVGEGGRDCGAEGKCGKERREEGEDGGKRVQGGKGGGIIGVVEKLWEDVGARGKPQQHVH